MAIPALNYSDALDLGLTTAFFPLIKLIRFQGLKKDVIAFIETKVSVSQLPSPFILMDHLDSESSWFQKLFDLKPWTKYHEKWTSKFYE